MSGGGARVRHDNNKCKLTKSVQRPHTPGKRSHEDRRANDFLEPLPISLFAVGQPRLCLRLALGSSGMFSLQRRWDEGPVAGTATVHRQRTASAAPPNVLPPNSAGTKVFLSNVPPHVKGEDIHNMCLNYGNIVNIEKANSRDPSSGQAFIVTTDSPDSAQSIVQNLNMIEYEGAYLKADFLAGDGRRRRGQRTGMAALTSIAGSNRQTDFPLRILVQSDMVGAIIGRQGSTIRHITQQTRARVDVHRKDNLGSLEKAITIYGNPENCTNACRKILEVMHAEASSTNKGSVVGGDENGTTGADATAQQQQHQHARDEEAGNTNDRVGSSCSEITLKILAHNNLIGRIIGKGGQTIKRIMSDTDTKITVSSINDISSFNLERIITVKGTIENMSRAEAQISQKLRQSYENDLQAMAPQSLMFPGLHPMAMMSTASMNYGNRQQALFNTSHTPFPYTGTLPAQTGPASETQETAFLYIPNSSVGAIIGTKGSHIRNIIRFSGAIVKIAQLESEKPVDPNCERKVTISGTAEAQWKAQYLIYEKMREEGFVVGNEDVRLTVEIHVPSAQVGRIIGKGGQNVRELQRVTGSVIKLSEQQSSPPAEGDETTVHIIGPFFSVQSAQRRIRAMVTLPPSSVIPPVTGARSRNVSQEGGVRSRRDGSATSLPGGAMTPQQQHQQQQHQQQSSQSSPSSQASSGQAQQQQQPQQ
ncbi:insulin-like growth factor 2 mRNA-binding protein 1 isoform X2 [Copidosoma floridanum]|uniref:insulin-like growth factor 2 mRNA-binding protein 1 isoform X2 n=1 Tax=Copidosoma floridanum TaxID=29053 RepID=UPI0006C980B9|nr:insulin-like growth factor 2 mRNA-binding protein 1 isoform X2 [Copidosoma floridanum]